tara:strand:+ start:303 stop:542 length:240 start_codon:yes stop_codon:yes gene_type:complete
MILYEFYDMSHADGCTSEWFRSKRAAEKHRAKHRREMRQSYKDGDFKYEHSDLIQKHEFDTNKDGLIEFLNRVCRGVTL